MLERSGFPLTRTQVTDFLLNREYTTNFLNLQQAIGELIDENRRRRADCAHGFPDCRKGVHSGQKGPDDVASVVQFTIAIFSRMVSIICGSIA